MEDDFLISLMFEEDEERVDRLNERQRLHHLRDKSDPFLMEESKFIKFFRLPQQGVLSVVEILSSNPEFHRGDIPPHIKVLSALNFYGQGCYQSSVGQDSMLSLSQPAVSQCLRLVSDHIVAHLLPLQMKFPSTPEEKAAVKQGFQLLGFGDAIGAVDGTHIAIFAPPETPHTAPQKLFYNRKGYYSINAQVTCDAYGKILHVNPNFPGSTHDAAVWGSSNLNQFLKEEYVGGVRNQWLIGDKGYPLLPWLMTPYPESPAGSGAASYNLAHAKARNAVELCFGKLKNRFRCLLKHRTLHYRPEIAAKIFLACCTLHNMFMNHWTADGEERFSSGDHELEDAAQAGPSLGRPTTWSEPRGADGCRKQAAAQSGALWGRPMFSSGRLQADDDDDDDQFQLNSFRYS